MIKVHNGLNLARRWVHMRMFEITRFSAGFFCAVALMIIMLTVAAMGQAPGPDQINRMRYDINTNANHIDNLQEKVLSLDQQNLDKRLALAEQAIIELKAVMTELKTASTQLNFNSLALAGLILEKAFMALFAKKAGAGESKSTGA